MNKSKRCSKCDSILTEFEVNAFDGKCEDCYIDDEVDINDFTGDESFDEFTEHEDFE